MALSENRGDREYDKFTEDLNGQTCVRIAPGAITDSVDGNELDIDSAGRARMYDTKVHDQLKGISSLLLEILNTLKLMAG